MEECVVKYATKESPSASIWLGGKLYRAKNGVLTLPVHASSELDEMLASEDHAGLNAHFMKLASIEQAEAIARNHMNQNRVGALKGPIGSGGSIMPPTTQRPPLEAGKPGGETDTLLGRRPNLSPTQVGNESFPSMEHENLDRVNEVVDATKFHDQVRNEQQQAAAEERKRLEAARHEELLRANQANQQDHPAGNSLKDRIAAAKAAGK